MKYAQITIAWLLVCSLSFGSCSTKKSEDTHEKYEKLSIADTTSVLQEILKHRQLDSVLAFAFEGQRLKIVQNQLIKKPLPLIMHNDIVEFTSVDSSSDRLRDVSNPRFFMKVSHFEKNNHGIEVSLYFQAIGLIADYQVIRDKSNGWRIKEFNFLHK
jgi:hypothetical protein